MPSRPRLSMLRSYTWADLLTLLNASCGSVTIFLCLGYIADARRGEIRAAFVLPVLALAFDVLDGYVARLDRRRQSVLGADLDSLADIVSFGVAPAVLGYTLGLRGTWDVVLLCYFICCGISRLARFNATAAALTDESTGKVRYFQGTPIPTSVVIVLLLAALYTRGLTGADFPLGELHLAGRGLHPITLLYAISGSLMISTVRVPKP
jgi:CDP-diacylglycerol--serine O-phosphatidyltransferase